MQKLSDLMIDKSYGMRDLECWNDQLIECRESRVEVEEGRMMNGFWTC